MCALVHRAAPLASLPTWLAPRERGLGRALPSTAPGLRFSPSLKPIAQHWKERRQGQMLPVQLPGILQAQCGGPHLLGHPVASVQVVGRVPLWAWLRPLVEANRFSQEPCRGLQWRLFSPICLSARAALCKVGSWERKCFPDFKVPLRVVVGMPLGIVIFLFSF